MNLKPVNIANKALEAVMNIVPSLSAQGEKIFLSQQLHSVRARLDAVDDQLREKQIRITKALITEQNPAARHALSIELDDILHEREKIEEADDALHLKDFGYKSTIQTLYEKAKQLLTGACTVLDSFVNYVTELFTKKKAV